eukprot:scaffold24092_cov62-Phaeocystis_antarctica.AAC.4
MLQRLSHQPGAFVKIGGSQAGPKCAQLADVNKVTSSSALLIRDLHKLLYHADRYVAMIPHHGLSVASAFEA